MRRGHCGLSAARGDGFAEEIKPRKGIYRSGSAHRCPALSAAVSENAGTEEDPRPGTARGRTRSGTARACHEPDAKRRHRNAEAECRKGRNMAVIELKNLTYTYGEGTPFCKKAVDNVSLSIEQGEFIGVIGHTGSGKSTLIQTLNGLLRPTSGQVLLNGKEIWASRRRTLSTVRARRRPLSVSRRIFTTKARLSFPAARSAAWRLPA